MITLSLTSSQKDQIQQLLFPGDGMESVAFILCGYHDAETGIRLLAHKVIGLQEKDYKLRSDQAVVWKMEAIIDILNEAQRRNMGIIKIHSHPNGPLAFSDIDDRSDRELFPILYDWVEPAGYLGSAVMTDNGQICLRTVTKEGSFGYDTNVVEIGKSLCLDHNKNIQSDHDDATTRVQQVFGALTYCILRGLKIGIVGCSGTGSIVIEMLARTGVGSLVIVDPERVEIVNLNRIIGATRKDAKQGLYKVAVMKRTIESMGTGVQVEAYPTPIQNVEAVKALANCDVLFGCVDSAEARHLMNKLSIYYMRPYFDVGVKVVADGNGGIDDICGCVNYLIPGGSSLHSRGVYDMEVVRAEALKRTDPEAFNSQLKQGYVHNAAVASPAVMPVNMLAASTAVNDFFARLHDYLDEDDDSVTKGFSITKNLWYQLGEKDSCQILAKYTGVGDTNPLLGLSELTVHDEERCHA